MFSSMLDLMFNRGVSFDNFILAAREGNVDTIRRYIDENSTNPAAINIADQYGSTALIWATDSGYTEVVSLLLAEGADPTLKNKKGETATWIQTRKDLQIKAQLEAKAVSEQIEVELTDEEVRIKVEVELTDEEMRIQAQLEKEEQNRQRATALASKAAIDSINFLSDQGIGPELFPDLIMYFSDWIRGASDDKKLETYSRAVLKVAAETGHRIAKHIDSAFGPNVELEGEIQVEIEKSSAPNASPSTEQRERMMQARLKTFGPGVSSDSLSATNHHQQDKENKLMMKGM